MGIPEKIKAIQDEVNALVKEAVQFAEESPLPAPEELYEDVYVQADCGNGDLSFWQGPISFTTPPTCGDNFGPYCYGAGAYTVFTAIAANPGDFINLNIIAGETEVGYDNLEIYDGVGNTGNLLYSADGDHSGVTVLSTSGTISMYIDGDGIWDASEFEDLNGNNTFDFLTEQSCNGTVTVSEPFPPRFRSGRQAR